MKKTSVLMVVVVMLVQYGCGGGGAAKTGFLSDYSRLRKESNTTLRNVDQRALAKYSTFMVDSVRLHFHSGAKAVEHRTKGRLTQPIGWLISRQRVWQEFEWQLPILINRA